MLKSASDWYGETFLLSSLEDCVCSVCMLYGKGWEGWGLLKSNCYLCNQFSDIAIF